MLTSFYHSYMMTTNTNSMQISSTQYQNASSVLDDIDDALAGTNHSINTVTSADARNQILNLEKAPYKPGTPVVGFETTQTTQYVRVYRQGVNSPQGGWIMRYSDIQGLTPAQIKDVFALPTEPTHYCFVNVPAGTQIYTGIANKIPEWGNGGAIQFELGEILPASCFTGEIPLP